MTRERALLPGLCLAQAVNWHGYPSFFHGVYKRPKFIPQKSGAEKIHPPIASQNRFGQIFRATTRHPLNGIVSYDRSAAFSWLAEQLRITMPARPDRKNPYALNSANFTMGKNR